MYSALLTYKKRVAGRRKKKVRGDLQWGGRVYAGRRTAAGGYLAFFSVAGTRHVTDLIMRIFESPGSHFFLYECIFLSIYLFPIAKFMYMC